MNQICMCVCYSIYQQKERSSYATSSLNNSTKFGNKPIYIDGAYWYKDACRWLRLKHIVYGTELKNIMERFIQHIKDRSECFDNNFPCKSHGCDRKHICNWLRMYILYLHMKMDRIRFVHFVTTNSLS